MKSVQLEWVKNKNSESSICYHFFFVCMYLLFRYIDSSEFRSNFFFFFLVQIFHWPHVNRIYTCIFQHLFTRVYLQFNMWSQNIPLIIRETVHEAHRSFAYFFLTIDLQHFRAVRQYLVPANEKKRKDFC